MLKAEIMPLFTNKPIISSRTVIQPMMDMDLNDFLSHTSSSMAVVGTELEDLFVEKCKELINSETEVLFSIHLKENNTYIGYFELKGLDFEPEIGIDLLENFQGQGVGSEVCCAVIDFIFENTNIESLKYVCFRNNTVSMGLAKKLGAVRIKEKPLFEKLQTAELSQKTIEESVGFDFIIHKINAIDWCR